EIEHAQLTVVVGSADFETSERLRIPLNSPTVEAHFFVRNQHGIVSYVADVIYRGDCVRFDIDLLRNVNSSDPDGGESRNALPVRSMSPGRDAR
ncbi:MAG TPA: hypothetical protein VG848_14470, partial [Acetobacteraceae bacterium]|nr:hypothetical protein [Acetobacteraceae bacterium]